MGAAADYFNFRHMRRNNRRGDFPLTQSIRFGFPPKDDLKTIPAVGWSLELEFMAIFKRYFEITRSRRGGRLRRINTEWMALHAKAWGYKMVWGLK